MLAILFWSIDWVAVRGEAFSDLENYIEGFSFNHYQYDRAASLLQWYTQEYLWRSLIYALGERFSFDTIFSYIALCTLIVSAVYVTLKSRSVIYLAVLANPLSVDLAFAQSRSAAGMAIIWMALLSSKAPWRIGLLALAPMIHSAMLVYSLVMLIPWESEYVRKNAGLYVGAVIIGAAAALGPLRSIILEGLGDRRAYSTTVSSGILFTAMLASYGLPFTFAPSRVTRDRTALIAVLSAVLSVSVTLSGGAGNRFVSLALPAFAVGISHIPSAVVRRVAFCWMMASSLIYYFLYWST